MSITKEERRKIKALKLLESGATDKELEIIESVQEVEDMVDQRLTDIETNLGKKVDAIGENLKKKLEQELVVEVNKEELKGEPGEPGKNYVLTDEDKMEIALSIDVPVVEKIIEKRTETIRQPIVTNNVTNEIKEVAVTDEPKVIAEKLNTLTEAVNPEVIRGWKDFERILRANVNPQLYTGVSETRVRELIRALAVVGPASPLTAKGDIWGFSTTNARVPVGADGLFLQSDSTQALGVKYAPDNSFINAIIFG